MTIQTLKIGGQTKRSKLGAHEVQIDFTALPQASQDFVIAYGLRQYIADGMAGSNDEVDAKAGIASRVRKLQEADFTRRASEGQGFAKADTLESRMSKIAKQAVRDMAKKQNVAVTKDQVEAAATAWLAKDKPRFEKEAQAQLDAEAATKASLAQADSSDILASLLAGQDQEPEEESEAEQA